MSIASIRKVVAQYITVALLTLLSGGIFRRECWRGPGPGPRPDVRGIIVATAPSSRLVRAVGAESRFPGIRVEALGHVQRTGFTAPCHVPRDVCTAWLVCAATIEHVVQSCNRGRTRRPCPHSRRSCSVLCACSCSMLWACCAPAAAACCAPGLSAASPRSQPSRPQGCARPLRPHPPRRLAAPQLAVGSCALVRGFVWASLSAPLPWPATARCPRRTALR